jgi:tetratricopeptide (TPR) repeat protein
LIVVVIYCYMFWGNLAGEDTPAGKAIAYLSSEFVEVEEFVAAVKSKQAELASERPSTKESVEVAVAPEAAVTPDTEMQADVVPVDEAAEQVVQNPVEPPPVSISYSHNQMRVKQNSAGVIESEASRPVLAMAESEQPPAPAQAGSDKNEKFVSAEVEKRLNNVDGKGRVIDPSQKSNSVKDSWITARKSFYQRNYEQSIQSYQEVIDNTEDNFDAYGELGNVYFNQGKNEQAAAAYYEAAAILVRKGQVRRAQSLMGLLRHLDKSKADELQALIDSVKS